MFQSPFNCNLQFIWFGFPSVKSWIGAVLLILSLSLNAAPQLTRNYAYRYFTSRDGLVQMQVQCAFQDRDGYLWFGTKGGVSRFDGNSFKNYSQSDGIPVGEMLAVGEWGYKKMFFYHYSFQFLHENDSLESVTIPDTVIFHRHDFQGIPLNENEILLINLMNKKTIEAGQNIHRHLLWNKKTRKFTTFNGIGKKILAYNEQFIVTSDALYKRKGVSVQKMYSFPNKYTTARVDWESGLFFMYNQESFSIDKYVFVNNEFRFSSVILKDITHPNFALLPDKSIVYFTNHYEARIYPDQEATFGMEIAFFEGAFVDREGNLWIMFNNGLYNFFNLNFIEYTFGFAKPDNIWSILEDDDHNMWFGSFGFGLWRMDKHGNLKEFNTECKGWDHQYMGSTRSKAGVLYMPTGHGLTILDKGKFTK